MIKKVLYLFSIILVTSCSNGLENNDVNNKVSQTPDEPDVKEKIIVQKTYVTDGNADTYFADEEVDASYWYVKYYHHNGTQGYTMMRLPTPYFDIIKVHRNICKWNNFDTTEYLGIDFFKRVSFEAYRAYKGE